MTNWLTFKQASEKYGIAESILREWKLLGYITLSQIGDVVMLEETSLMRYVDIYKEEELREDSTAWSIRKMEQQREMILSTLDDELYLLATQSFYQPLFHVLIQELSGLISNDWEREIFLALSFREPIALVAQRYGLYCEEMMKIYKSVFDKVSEDAAQIPLFCKLARTQLLKGAVSGNPLDVPLEKVLAPRAARLLHTEANITTVYGLLQLVSTYGWATLKKSIRGMGQGTYKSIIKSLEDAHYIVTSDDNKTDLSPEISVFVD